MLKRILSNPFEYFSTLRLFIFGVVVTVFGSWLAVLCSARFDGVLDMHFRSHVRYWQPLADNLVNLFSLIAPLFLLGKLINRKTRFIDVANAAIVSRTPVYLLPPFNAGDLLNNAISSALPNPDIEASSMKTSDTILVVGFGLFALLVVVVYLVLLFRGFKTATNSKLSWHIVAFAGCVALAEVISKFIIIKVN